MANGYYINFNPEDTDISPFVAHKRWTVSNGVGISSAADISITGSYYTGSNVYIGTYSTSSRKGGLDQFVSGSSNEPAYNGKYQFIMHANIDKMFYRFASKGIQNEQGSQAFQSHWPTAEYRDLHKEAVIISIPQSLYGESIQRGSFSIKDRSGAGDINIVDDSYTNLYDKSIDTSSMVNDDKLIVHVPFTEGYQYSNIDNNTIGHPTGINKWRNIRNEYNPGLDYNSDNVHQIHTRGVAFEKSMHGYGLKLHGHSGSYAHIWRHGDVDPKTDLGRNQEFALSMWLKIPTSQSVSHSFFNSHGPYSTFAGPESDFSVIKKTKHLHTTNVIVSKRNTPWNWQGFPFEVRVGNSWGSDAGKVMFMRGNGSGVKTIKTPLAYNDNTWRHWLFQKTGSRLEIYADGKRVAQAQDFSKTGRMKGTTVSKQVMSVGGLWYSGMYRYGQDQYTQLAPTGPNGSNGKVGYETITPKWHWSSYEPVGYDSTRDKVVFNHGLAPMIMPFTGSVDEIRLYHQAIPSASLAFMSSSVSNTNIVGNIFYDYGLATITDPKPKYDGILQGTGANGWYASFQNNWTIYEHEYLCHIKSNDFDLTMNPTLREDNVLTDERLKGISSHSDFSPYITTVGLYNDEYDLLAVGKVAQPVKKPKNMDTTIVLRFDK